MNAHCQLIYCNRFTFILKSPLHSFQTKRAKPVTRLDSFPSLLPIHYPILSITIRFKYSKLSSLNIQANPASVSYTHLPHLPKRGMARDLIFRTSTNQPNRPVILHRQGLPRITQLPELLKTRLRKPPPDRKPVDRQRMNWPLNWLLPKQPKPQPEQTFHSFRQPF